MARRRKQTSNTTKLQDDLAFPVSFREQARFLDMADRFLALGNPRDGHNLVPIDSDHRFRSGRWKKAS
jgi:hypothetical protein